MSDNNYSKHQQHPPQQRSQYNRSYNHKDGSDKYQQSYPNQQMPPNMSYPYPYPMMHYTGYVPPP